MYKISEFSKITNLTIKALRYYDEQGILVPSYRDTNGYRYYDEQDFNRAELIFLLRQLDFSILELKDVLENMDTKSDLSYYLEEKKSMILKNIKKEKALMKQIDLHINHHPIVKEIKNMKYEILLKEIAPVYVASIRYEGKYSDVGNYIGTIYKSVKNQADGCPFNCYYDSDYKADSADIELCVPTKTLIQGKDINAKKLPKIKALCTTHIGNYDTINLAYKALYDYGKGHNLTFQTPSREYYVKGPGMVLKGNPEKYITEIAIPIVE